MMKLTTATMITTTSNATSKPLSPLARSAPLPAPVLIYRHLAVACHTTWNFGPARTRLCRRLRKLARTHQRCHAEAPPLRVAERVMLDDVTLETIVRLLRRCAHPLLGGEVALADDFVDEQSDAAAALAYEQHAAGFGEAGRLAREETFEIDQR